MQRSRMADRSLASQFSKSDAPAIESFENSPATSPDAASHSPAAAYSSNRSISSESDPAASRICPTLVSTFPSPR